MPFPAHTYRIFIASPSDVDDERQAATESIHDWNTEHAVYEGLVLLPVKWETDTIPEYASPENTPQDAINRQLVQDCDILVGIFWTRLGSATAAAASGTVEEINHFVNSKRPVFLYFCDRPLPRDVNTEQVDKLNAFREAASKRAITRTFKDPTELQERLSRDLLKYFREMKRSVSLQPQKSTMQGPHEALWFSCAPAQHTPVLIVLPSGDNWNFHATDSEGRSLTPVTGHGEKWMTAIGDAMALGAIAEILGRLQIPFRARAAFEVEPTRERDPLVLVGSDANKKLRYLEYRRMREDAQVNPFKPMCTLETNAVEQLHDQSTGELLKRWFVYTSKSGEKRRWGIEEDVDDEKKPKNYALLRRTKVASRQPCLSLSGLSGQSTGHLAALICSPDADMFEDAIGASAWRDGDYAFEILVEIPVHDGIPIGGEIVFARVNETIVRCERYAE